MARKRKTKTRKRKVALRVKYITKRGTIRWNRSPFGVAKTTRKRAVAAWYRKYRKKSRRRKAARAPRRRRYTTQRQAFNAQQIYEAAFRAGPPRESSGGRSYPPPPRYAPHPPRAYTSSRMTPKEIDRLAKLDRLSHSSNPHEAALARERAAEIRARY